MTISSKTPTVVREEGRCTVSVVGLAPPSHGWLAGQAGQALNLLGATGEVRVRVVDDVAIAAAHVKYSGIEGTTDVLTFDLAKKDLELDVDLLVCLDEAVRQAASRGYGPEREMLLYIIHGILHCLGHDDHDEAAAARMHAEEDRILEALGVGRTYHAGSGGAGGEA
jgi:probable rRNA maturation factor